LNAEPHIVIVGGGFGGLDAARVFAGAPVRVTLVDRHNYHLFQPLLYQVATASLSPGDIASPIRWVLRHQKNVTVVLADVKRVDAASRTIFVDIGEPPAGESTSRLKPIAYDYLILAPGATHAYFGHPEWARRAPGLKTLDDALQIRREILLAFEAAERETDPERQRRLLTFVIVGGGPTGVELAGALAEIARQTLTQDFRHIDPASSRIVLIEAGPHVLNTFSVPLPERSRESLGRLGIEVLTGTMVTAVDDHGVAWVSTGAGPKTSGRIDAQTVLWAAGVAASPLGASLGVPLDRAGRVAAEPDLTISGHPEIFVAGDICSFLQDGKPLPGVAQVAKQEGAHAARNVLRAIANQPMTPFRYKDYGSMATIGRGSAVAEIHRFKATGLLAWLIWLFVHIFWLIGFRNRLAVLGEWAWAYLTFQRRVRVITGERLWPDS
jgi:NADH dehydrogenase